MAKHMYIPELESQSGESVYSFRSSQIGGVVGEVIMRHSTNNIVVQ